MTLAMALLWGGLRPRIFFCLGTRSNLYTVSPETSSLNISPQEDYIPRRCSNVVPVYADVYARSSLTFCPSTLPFALPIASSPSTQAKQHVSHEATTQMPSPSKSPHLEDPLVFRLCQRATFLARTVQSRKRSLSQNLAWSWKFDGSKTR